MTVPPAAKAWLVDTGERVGSTLAEAGLGWLTVEIGHLPAIYGVLLAGALAVLKAQVAKFLNGTVSPASFAPAQQPGQAEQDAPPDVAPEMNNIPTDATPVGVTAPQLGLVPAPGGPKLGRRPKPPDPRDFRLTRYLVRKLPTPPAHVNWAQFVPGFPMLLNNSIGDCGEAGWLHMLQVWLAAIGRLFTPTDAQVLGLYEVVAGYKPGEPSTDNGTVLRDLLKYVKANAVAGGQRITAYVAVDPRNRLQVKQALAEFGCLYAGVELTQAAYQDQGVHWKRVRGAKGKPDPNLGHCVVYTGYDARGVKTVTWGQEGTATWGWHDDCCVELWAVLSPDWMTAAGKNPDGVDWATLQQDLQAL